MVRSFRDRVLRFGCGVATGALLTAGFHNHELWTWIPLVVLFGMFTADVEPPALR